MHASMQQGCIACVRAWPYLHQVIKQVMHLPCWVNSALASYSHSRQEMVKHPHVPDKEGKVKPRNPISSTRCVSISMSTIHRPTTAQEKLMLHYLRMCSLA
jgi:hypothetical protein